MSDDSWIGDWLDGVAGGASTMSQRALASIDSHGGIDAAVAAARARGVHLLALTDDKGKRLVAASRHPFETLC